MGPATTGPSVVTTYLTAVMALMRQIAVRSQSILVINSGLKKWKSLLSPPKMQPKQYHPWNHQIDIFSLFLLCFL